MTVRNEQYWKIIKTLPPGMPVADGQFVASVVELMDRITTEEELKAFGMRLGREEMNPEDKDVLRRVYEECRRAIRVFNGVGDAIAGITFDRSTPRREHAEQGEAEQGSD